MKTLCIYRAIDTGNPSNVIPVNIQICDPIPEPATIPEAEIQFAREGKMLFEVLRDSLPAGTLDQLTVELLKYKASHFVVRF
jgi:hypothetical protein